MEHGYGSENMNQPLRKYKLEFDSALSYVREELEGVNTLSILLLNLLKFEDGIFFYSTT